MAAAAIESRLWAGRGPRPVRSGRSQITSGASGGVGLLDAGAGPPGAGVLDGVGLLDGTGRSPRFPHLRYVRRT
ncbi:hypothetical protein GCM10010519_40270 [Streptomyces lactacystinicus]